MFLSYVELPEVIAHPSLVDSQPILAGYIPQKSYWEHDSSIVRLISLRLPQNMEVNPQLNVSFHVKISV